MTIGKTIKGLRASGKRNTSPVKRAEGGPIGNPGRISGDSVATARRLREESPSSLGNTNALVTGAGAATAAHHLLKSKGMFEKILGPKVGTAVRGLTAGIGAGAAAIGAKGIKNDYNKMMENEGEASRIEKGLVKEGEEDRKSGGRVRKPSK